METKANPNPNGCLARALPDEPFLVLLARDPCAPIAIRFWADQRAQLGVEGDRRQDAEQLAEALETADAMAAWREANDGAWRPGSVGPRLEGMARVIAAACSPEENVDLIWTAHLAEARAAIVYADGGFGNG